MNKSIINIFSGAVGYILPLALNLIFTPIIMQKLGSEAFGLQSLVNVIIGFLMVADMGLDIPITRFVAAYNVEHTQDKLKKLLSTTLQLYLLIGIFGAIIICAIAPFLVSGVFKVSTSMMDEAQSVFYLAGVGFIAGVFGMWGKALFNGLLRYDISNGISLASNVISLVCGTILVYNGFSVVAYVLVRIICSFITGVCFLLVARRVVPGFKLHLGIDTEIWKSLKIQIGYGFLFRLSGVLTSRLDQTLIGIWIGVAAVGYYAIPILITTSLNGFVNSMTHYLFPRMSELNSLNRKQEIEHLYLRSSRMVGVLSFFMFTPFVVFGGKVLEIWVGADVAQNSQEVFVLVLIATFINVLFLIICNMYIVGIGKMRLFTQYTLARGAVIAVACLLLLPVFRLPGAGWAMIITSLLDVGFFYYVVGKYLSKKILLDLGILYLKLLLVSIISGSIVQVLLLYNITSWFSLFMSSCLYSALFLLLTLVFRIWNQEEKELFGIIKARLAGK